MISRKKMEMLNIEFWRSLFWGPLFSLTVSKWTRFSGTWTKRTRQNGPRFRTKRTTSRDKTDHVSGQNGPCFRTKRITFLDKTGHVLGIRVILGPNHLDHWTLDWSNLDFTGVILGPVTCWTKCIWVLWVIEYTLISVIT